VSANDLDWSSGNWGIKVTNTGTAESPTSDVTFPGGIKSGNALEVYYRITDIEIPQFWVFLTDGFWRQVSYGNPFGTSYRLFRYYSSEDEDCDKPAATAFRVNGITSRNQLEIELGYENNAAAGDRFEITASVLLLPPSRMITSMEATITVKNVTGRDVTPKWDGHRTLAEQWELFGISSMYVADNLTGGLPAWYSLLDPDHDYVGITNDSDYLNDGFSQNGEIYVSTHDVKTIVARDRRVSLDHETCPFITVPEYDWYKELVLLDQVSRSVKIKHLYASDRNHLVELLSCSGITGNSQNLKWAVTYNRSDENMVDGDNIQVKLGMDDFLNIWPNEVFQTIHLNLKTGRGDTALPGWIINLLLN